MIIEDEQHIDAPIEAVWAALNDTDVLQACIPGCQSIERHSDTELSAVAQLKIGPIKANFNLDATLSNMNPPHGYTLSGEGKGGIAGFAKGSADVALSEADGGGTLLKYTVTADVGGKIAQLGSRLIQSTAKKLSKQFFENLEASLKTPVEG